MFPMVCIKLIKLQNFNIDLSRTPPTGDAEEDKINKKLLAKNKRDLVKASKPAKAPKAPKEPKTKSAPKAKSAPKVKSAPKASKKPTKEDEDNKILEQLDPDGFYQKTSGELNQYYETIKDYKTDNPTINRFLRAMKEKTEKEDLSNKNLIFV